MSTAIVQSSEPVTLVGGGKVAPADLGQALGLAPTLVAADGGANRALSLGHPPVAVIGDLDSLDAASRAALPPGRIHRVPEQDTTDFEKCLARIEAPLILGLGFAGPRLDHWLAVANALVRHPHRPCVILGGPDIAFAAPPRLSLPLEPGTRVSLFPLAPVTGRSAGLRWPIEGLHLAPDGRIGTSNEALGPVHLEFDAPGMLVILPRAALAVATAFLRRPVPPLRAPADGGRGAPPPARGG
ncbi:MAG: thiamine diphosphokinase [Pseudomonadota bacterium]